MYCHIGHIMSHIDLQVELSETTFTRNHADGNVKCRIKISQDLL